MGRVGKNRISRRKIREALPTMPTPFTSKEMADVTGYGAKRVAGLLRTMDEVVGIPNKRRDRARVKWVLSGL